MSVNKELEKEIAQMMASRIANDLENYIDNGELMSQFKHDPNYEDVRILSSTGYWPSATIPEWVAERAARYGCNGSHPMITQEAMEFEIKKLEEERNEARYEARILAHAYEHDSRPPDNIVKHALTYDVDQHIQPHTADHKYEAPDILNHTIDELKKL